MSTPRAARLPRLGPVLVSALVLFGSSCGDPPPKTLAPPIDGAEALRAAPDAVDEAGSVRFEMSFTVPSPVGGMTMFAEGEEDFERGTGRLTMTFDPPDAPPGFQEPVEVVLDGRFAYVKGEVVASLGGGDGWVRVDERRFLGSAAGGLDAQPAQFVEWLRGAGRDVVEIGAEVVRGVPTVHVRVMVSPADVVERARDAEAVQLLLRQMKRVGFDEPMPLDVWLDEDALPRRIEAEIGRGSVSTELFDYGAEVEVDAPADYEDLTDAGG